MEQELMRAGAAAVMAMLVSVLPAVTAISYAWRPTDQKLALMRPLSLAAIFAAIHIFFAGVTAVFRMLPRMPQSGGFDMNRLSPGIAETAAPLFVVFGLLTVAWLCVAVGMRRSQ